MGQVVKGHVLINFKSPVLILTAFIIYFGWDGCIYFVFYYM